MRHIIFGESHGPAIGVVLEGLPSGVALNMDFIASELARRAPGGSIYSTARSEADIPKLLSGVFEGHTTGTPLCAIIENTDTRSGDYANLKRLPRPSHADFTAGVRYSGYQDYRGGGHFSGRLTAPLVFAGAVAKLVLRERGVEVSAQISRLGGMDHPTRDQREAAILAAKEALDSVGGAICCTVTGLPAGLGSPDYGRNVEGIFSQQLFAVPAVKAVAFGAGFAFADLRGSQANDAFYVEQGAVKTRTNRSGGINGGITNGMPVEFEVALRPTPSIAQEQDTVDLETMEEAKLAIRGRHDPCVVQRAVPVIEAAAALAACQVMGI